MLRLLVCPTPPAWFACICTISYCICCIMVNSLDMIVYVALLVALDAGGGRKIGDIIGAEGGIGVVVDAYTGSWHP